MTGVPPIAELTFGVAKGKSIVQLKFSSVVCSCLSLRTFLTIELTIRRSEGPHGRSGKVYLLSTLSVSRKDARSKKGLGPSQL